MREMKQPGLTEFIFISAILMATVALTIDVVLPALGGIAAEFQVASPNSRQWVIMAVFVGLTIGQLVFGPISDHLGRRPTVFFGVGVFVVGSLICAASTSFEMLLVGRALQGFGGSGPRVVTVAMIRDRFVGETMARVMSLIMGVFIMVPILAPTLGQAVLAVTSWRVLFLLLCGLVIAGAFWLWLRQPETLAARRPFNGAAITGAVREVLGNRQTMLYTLASGCCFGALMGYINSSQQLFEEVHGVGDMFGVYFGICAAFIGVATLLNASLVRHVAMEKICFASALLQTLWALLFLALMAYRGPTLGLLATLLFICPTLLLLGLNFGNYTALSLRPLGHIAGMASAITASLSTLVSLVIASAVGQAFDMTMRPMLIGFALCGMSSMIMILLARRKAAKPI